MPQNRNKLIDLFTANLANAVVHQVLEKAIDNTEIANKYVKEFKTSWDIAKKYREKINPQNPPLPDKDLNRVKKKIIKKVNSELQVRISHGYENIDLTLIEELVNKALMELKII